MAGVKGRSGRRRNSLKTVQWTFDQVADLTFQQAGILIKDESIPLDRRVSICLPLALKRIPDKVITANVNMALSDELAKRILAVMDTTKPKRIAPPDVYVTPITTSTCNEAQDEPKQ